MFYFSYFESNVLQEINNYNAFWKCNEKIKASPFFHFKKMQLISRLHVIYLQIIQ